MEGFHIGAGHIFNPMEADEAMKGLIRRRFVDDRYVIAKGDADVLLVKLLRRQIPFFVIDLVLVAIGEVKGLNGLAKGDAFGLINFSQHFLFTSIRIFSGQDQFPQLHGVFSQ